MSAALQGLLYIELKKVITKLQNLPAAEQGSLEATRELLAVTLSTAIATAVQKYLNSSLVITTNLPTGPAPGPVTHTHPQPPQFVLAPDPPAPPI